MHTHAIGDAANRSFLRVFKAVRDAGYTESRLTMGHTVLVDPADLQSFKDLDVIANFYTQEAAQPFETYRERLGEERYNNLMPLGRLHDLGVKVSLSQDYPTTPVNPFEHMHAAVTRSHVGSEEILGLEQDILTVSEAIEAYTLNGAYVVGAESYNGSLEVGKRADFIVIDRNLLEIEPDDILNATVLRTYLNGKEVYRHE